MKILFCYFCSRLTCLFVKKKVNTKKNAFFNRLVHAANVVIFSNQSNRLTSIFLGKKTNFSEYSEEHDSDPETLKIS